MTRLLLVGAGHSHLEVLRRLAAEDHPPVELTTVCSTPRQLYSGMIPGFLYGEYTEDQVSVELRALVERAGGRLEVGRAVAVDPAAREVVVEDGGGERRPVGYDLVSFNVGSRAAGEDVEGVTEHSALVKPMHRATELRERIDRLATKPVSRPPGGSREVAVGRRAVVVGGGAAGVEVACALATAFDRQRRRDDDADSVTLLEGGPRILSGYSNRFHDRARRVLQERGVRVLTRSPVSAVGADAVELEGGRRLPADLAVWLTGPAAPPLFEGSGLPLDDAGFLLVDDALRSLGDERVLGAGDCVTPEHRPETPKAGVYAVREAPVLWKSLMAALGARDEPPRYEPQESFLSILNTADGNALLRWKWIVSHSRWAWWLKDWIDRRFVGKYQVGG